MSRTIKTLVVAFAAAACFTGAAQAQSLKIGYGDLDMSQPVSGEILLKRIDKAARKVCGDRSEYSQLDPYGVSACRHSTAAQAVKSLGIPTLTAAWAGKTANAAFAAK